MCSVPGVPTPGSEVSVVVTRVTLNQNCGLVELWVNLNKEIKHVYEQMREEIQVPERRFCGAEGKRGDLCLVNVGEKWHRTRIVSVHEESYNVFLMDQGRPHSTSSDKLAWGKDECFILPPEIERCVLANILALENNWPERATNFLKSLPGKEFHGFVRHALMPDRTILLDLPIISKNLCKEGVAKKIPVSEFKNLAIKCLNLPEENTTETIMEEQSLNVSHQLESDNRYFYPELMTSTLESIRVAEVIDPGRIFCELAIYSKAVKILTEQMNQELKNEASVDQLHPQTFGMACAAKGIDGKWRRATLKQQITSKDGTVEVFFVDEGKTELVRASNVQKLDRKFLRMPVVTYNCKLEGVKNKQWEQKEIDYLKSIILNQTIVARFDSHILPEDQYGVSLYASNAACINDNFLEKAAEEINDASTNFPHKLFVNCATNSAQTSFIQRYNSPFSPMETPLCDLLTVGASVGVKISCIDSANKFWCQTSQCDQKLDVLMKDLQSYYASVHPKPLVESVCVARNPDDLMWYRAKIITNQLFPDVEVRLIDFGRTKKVLLQELRPIDPTFLRLDAQAFQCSLFNVPPADVNSANEEFHKFVDANSAENSGLKCVIKEVSSNKEGTLLNVVDLRTRSESTFQVLSEKIDARPVGFTRSDHGIEVNSKEKISVSYSETVRNFYCQLDRNSQLLRQVQSDVEVLVAASVYSDYSFVINDLCIARYSDAKWQRGQVVEISPDLKVHFVDHGGTLAINKTDIQPFPISNPNPFAARTIPVLAVPLALFNVPDKIPQEINQWFAEKVVGKSLSMTVLGKGSNGKLMVDLFDDLKSLNAQVREKTVNVAQTGKQLCNGRITSPVSNAAEEKMDVSNRDMAKQKVMQKSPTKQSEKLEIADGPITSQNALNGSMAKKPTISNQGKINSPKVPTYKKPVVSFEPQVLYASSISGPNYFWCQLGNTDLDEIKKLAQIEGQVPQELYFTHSLTPFSPCLALYTCDNQWYRAQVIEKNVNNTNKLSVVFVDYGNEEDIDAKDLRPISPSLLEIAPQALLCRLEQMEEQKEEDLDDEFYNEFYNQLVNKPLNVKVLRMGKNGDVKLPQYTVQIDDVGLHKVLDLYGITVGEQSPQDKLCQLYRKSAFQNILYGNPNALLNKSLETIVTFNSGPAHFWCQLCDSEKLDEIYKKAQKAGLDKDPFFDHASFIESLSPESPCLAYDCDDDEWYRAQVVSKEGGKLKVLYVDYGNEKELLTSDVMQLPESLIMVQPQVFLCRLEHFDENAGEWDEKLYHLFYKTMVDKLFDLRAVSMEHNDEFKVPKYTIEIDASNAEELRRIFSHQSNEMSASETSMFKKPQLKKAKTVVVRASCVWGPDYFWCQFADRVQLDEIQNLAKNEGRTSQDINFTDNLVPGDPCIALCAKDCAWYRAQILNKTEDKFSVLFIDYGNEDDVMMQNVRPISQTLLKVPPRAFLTSLDGFNLSEGEWDEKVYDYFKEFLGGHLLKVTPFRRRSHGNNKLTQFVVEIKRGSTSVNEEMQKYWKERSKLDYPSTQEGSKLDYPSTQEGSKLDYPSTQEGSKLDYPSTQERSKLDYPSTQERSKLDYPSTQERSKLDYPSTQERSKLDYPSTQERSKLDYPSTPERSKLDYPSTPERSKLNYPSTQERSKLDYPSTQERSKLDYPSMQLNENEQTSKQKVTYKNPNVSFNCFHVAYASCIVDPHFFWCQVDRPNDTLIINKMAQEAGLIQPRPPSLNQGDSCLALFSDDNQWYRALVGENDGKTFNVLFIDYGNEADAVTRMDTKILPQNLLDEPPLAFLCTLHGFEKSQGTWDDKVNDDFYDLILNKRLDVKILTVEENPEWGVPQYSVHVKIDGGTDVNILMEKYWKRSTEQTPKGNKSEKCQDVQPAAAVTD